MCFLLRRSDDDYRLCYSEPKRPYVIDFTGTYWCAKEYADMCNEERELEAYLLMDTCNSPIDSWADVSENNLGLVVSIDLVEYMLQGKTLNENEFIELKESSNAD